jgi:hypothetical protein
MLQALQRCSVAVDVSLFRKSQSWNLYLYILIYKYKTIFGQKNRIFLTATLQRCNGLKKSFDFA